MIDTLVYLGLGSNLSSPRQQLESALSALKPLSTDQQIDCSSFYLSRPLGPQDQNDFVNAVAAFRTPLAPLDLLDQLQTIELQQGRVRKAHRWGPRTLDLDILLFGDKAIDLPRLKVPHYHMMQRNFVILPLFELAPNLVFPDGQSIAQVVATLPQDGIEKLN